MVLSLVELTSREEEAIGQSIVGLEKPDLSMFPIGVRDEILRYSVRYLVKQLKHIAPAAAAKRIPILMDLVTESFVREDLKWDIRKAAESLGESEPVQDMLFVYLGEKEKLLEKAQRFLMTRGNINPPSFDLNHNLDYILSLYKLAGETLDSNAIGNIGLAYMAENISPNRVVEVYRKFKERGIEQKLKKLPLPEIIRACESQIGHTAGMRGTKGREEDVKFAGEAIAFMLSLASRGSNPINIAEKAASLNCFSVAYYIASPVSKAIGEEQSPAKKRNYSRRLETIADRLLEAGLFSRSKAIYASLGKGFDNEKVYGIFIEEIRKNPHSHELLYSTIPMVSYLLNDVPEQELRAFADRTYELTKSGRSFRSKKGLVLAYDFVSKAYRKLNETELAAEVEQKIQRIRQSDNTKKARGMQPKEEVRIHQKNLGDALLEKDGFIDDVVKAYDTGGLAAVKKVIQNYGSRLTEKDFTHNYRVHPVEIVEAVFAKIGRGITDGKQPVPKLRDDYALSTARYALTHGITLGTGYGSYHHSRDNPHLREQISPVAWALGIADLLLQGSGDMSSVVKLAETAAKLGNTDVPPILYRAAAAEQLSHVTQQPRAWDKDFEVDKGPAYSAWEYYTKVGDRGLTSFVKKNFLKGIPLAR